MAAWQVEAAEGKGHWLDFEGCGLDSIRAAQEAGHRAAAFLREDGCCCVVDFETEVRLNTDTGSVRQIRRLTAAPCTAAPPAEMEPSPGPSVEGLRSRMLPSSPKRRRLGTATAASLAAAANAAQADGIVGGGGASGSALASATVSVAGAGQSSHHGETVAVVVPPSMGNGILADIFEEMAAIQKLKRDRFRALAYQKAAQALRAHPEAIVSGAQARHIQGIGAGMARRIDVVLTTGELDELKELKQDRDVVALRELRSVHGIGAVRAADLVAKGVRSLQELRAHVATGHVRLDSAQSVGLKYAEEFAKKIPRAEMVEHEALLKRVRDEKHPKIVVMVCGSYRRGKAECGDIDVLITASTYTTSHPQENAAGALLRGFVQSLRTIGYVTDDLAAGASKYMGACTLPAVALHRRIDIRCFRFDQFHFGTLYFTGSAGLSVRLRMRAMELGLRLSEYGLERPGAMEQIHADSERAIFDALGVDYLEPHER